jgi:hypothetical protein
MSMALLRNTDNPDDALNLMARICPHPTHFMEEKTGDDHLCDNVQTFPFPEGFVHRLEASEGQLLNQTGDT